LAESHEIAKQIEVELALLMNIERAFRIALDWKTDGRGNLRKLSTLRFVTRSFERHLARIRMLSEYGGYMHLVTDTKPHLASAVQGLKKLRDGLQAHLERMMLRLEHISADETAAFEGLCAELEHYLEDLSAHGQKEMELLQRSFAQEDGGSG
jgi:iron-sulfur cluster repair protein YtfE (RIC family)